MNNEDEEENENEEIEQNDISGIQQALPDG